MFPGVGVGSGPWDPIFPVSTSGILSEPDQGSRPRLKATPCVSSFTSPSLTFFVCTGLPRFTALRFSCCCFFLLLLLLFFYKLKARPTNSKRLGLALLLWPGTKPTRSLTYACSKVVIFTSSVHCKMDTGS